MKILSIEIGTILALSDLILVSHAENRPSFLSNCDSAISQRTLIDLMIYDKCVANLTDRQTVGLQE